MTGAFQDTRGSRRTVAALVALLALAVLLNFVNRGAIGIAAPKMKADLGLSATTFGLAASAFFWTYGAMQPLVGWISDRVPVYRALAFALALWSLSTLLTGFVHGLALLVVLGRTGQVAARSSMPSSPCLSRRRRSRRRRCPRLW